MHQALSSNQFFVKEHVGMFKSANNFDVFDPSSNQKIMECREPNLGIFTKLLRFTDFKRMTPFAVEVRATDGAKIVTVKRGISLFRSVVEVFDENDQKIGYFRQKMLSIGGKFDVHDNSDQIMCTLKGKWTSWDFKFMKDETELAHVAKQWAGLGKELFTSADNYMLEINQAVPKDNPVRMLIIGAVLCIDMVLKE